MEHFVTLERAIACPRASVGVAAETAAQVLSEAGYRRGLGFGPTASYVRPYRPTWAVVAAVIGAIPTIGISLLLLLVRTKDHCHVVIEDGPYGVVALVSGRVPSSLPARLEAATGQYPAGQYPDPSSGPQQQPPPMLFTPSGGQVAPGPAHSPQAILRPATPVPGMPGGELPFPIPGRPAGPGQGGYPSGRPGPGQPFPPGGDPFGQPQHPRPNQPDPAAPFHAPVGVRPPSRLAPPIPVDSPHHSGAGASGPMNGGPAPDPESDSSISSTSGRVPWAAGGRSASIPPPPVNPVRPTPLPPPPVPPAPISPMSGMGGPVSGPGPSPFPGGPPPPVPPAPAVGPGGGDPAGHGWAVASGAAPAATMAAPVLRVDSGELLELTAFCLLGREPVPGDGDPPAHLVKFEDSKLSVSKTHLAYGLDAQGVWVIDRNSTNGTTLIDPSGRRMPCTPGARLYVPVGGQIQIGQRRITVEDAGAPASGA